MAVMAQSGSATPASSPAAPATTTTSTAAPGTSKVGIIDIQQAIVATNEGARDFEALAKKFEPKLNTQGDKMNEDARASLVKSIESKQKSLQRSAEDAQNEFQQQQNEVAQRILQKMAPVIDKYAKENGYTLLLDSSNPWPQGPLLWATQGVDVTKPIVDAYNAQSGVPAPPKPAASATGAAKPATGTTGTAPKPAASTPPKQ
jgi:outer membrane protein